MKELMLALPLMFVSLSSWSEPYVSGFWTKGSSVYISQGATFMPTSFEYERTFTNVAIFYHPVSAGSVIPQKMQSFIPPESWACTFGGGYAGAQGGISVGVGCGFNLLDSVRAWGSEILGTSSNLTLRAAARQIAPGSGPLNLYASRQWDNNQIHPMRFAPRWFLGASFGF